MKLGIATVSISGDLPEKVEAIAAAGFDGLELFETDFVASDIGPRDLARLIADSGLELFLFQPFRDFEGLPEPLRSRAFERAERKFDLMGELGTDLVLVCSNVSPNALGGIDRAADDLAELGERAARRGIRIGYEALAWGRHVSDHRDAWEIVRRARRPNVGIILDSFHTLARGIDPDSIRAIPADRIFFVQLADAPRIAMDLLYWSRHFRNMPGEGDLDLGGFVRAIAATGYDGVYSLEVFNDLFRGASPQSIAAGGRRSLVNLMDRVSRSAAVPGVPALPIPGPIGVRAVEFVEFAAGHAEASEFEALLGTLGFEIAGRHRSKKVSLFRQGAVNLVLNSETSGLAHANFVTHGSTAYAIGLKVADAAATVQRATALGASVFEQPVAEGELSIPAVRGVGGGLIYFLDESSELGAVWEREFGIADAPQPGAGLMGVDHVAQTMTYPEMLSWVLFYTSIFAMAKAPMVDVIDPAGVVRSQAIENATGTLRLTLNGADNNRTFAGRFVSETFGSSIQHIALSTSDILATAEALALRGFQPLAIPANYYDDLVARFGLDDAVVRRLRLANILYDRDEHGEFLQLYSRTFGDGFFFEIVERRSAYRGYGGPNAPFRVAAQQRAMRKSADIR